MEETAVEWLCKQYHLRQDIEIVKQAKEMEKQEIENAFHRGIQEQTARALINCERKTPEQYYNERYNK